MGADSEAGTLFKARKLAEAIVAATAAVRKAPSDSGARMLLAEFLLFQGGFERIDTLLDAIATMETLAGPAVAEFRQLLRAEVARRQLFSEGRVPDFIGGPTPAQRAALAALVALRADDPAAAASAVAESEGARPRAPGMMDGTSFDDWRDGDDLFGGSLEVLTTTGKYFWVPFDRITSLEPHAARRPRDLFWQRISLAVKGGPDGDVYLPVLYPPIEPITDDLRLGHITDWFEPATGVVRGVGQKIFMIGEEGVPVLQIGTITASE